MAIHSWFVPSGDLSFILPGVRIGAAMGPDRPSNAWTLRKGSDLRPAVRLAVLPTSAGPRSDAAGIQAMGAPPPVKPQSRADPVAPVADPRQLSADLQEFMN